MKTYQSWGKFPVSDPLCVRSLTWRSDCAPALAGEGSFLPFGEGRSYGDCCLNNGQTLLDTAALNRFISFDAATGVLWCEAGTLLKDILEFSVPRGWFLSVVPGTQEITVGGAVANDIHGKNHHRDGTFGAHVLELELLRSDGKIYKCSPQENAELFKATIGGLGLTGLILSVRVQLKAVSGAVMDAEHIKFEGLDAFLQLSEESDDYAYTAAWVDALDAEKPFQRGIFTRANHAASPAQQSSRNGKAVAVPFDCPPGLLNTWDMRLFNRFYFNRQAEQTKKEKIHYSSVLFPLDRLGHWNRLYGRRGFLQYQFVLPQKESVAAIFEKIRQAKRGAFLAVMKMFGDKASPGLLSFPQKGITVAMDFPNTGKPLLDLLDQLDKIVVQDGGRVYLAKDARMSPESFKAFYPRWETFAEHTDPRFSSDLWRRVTGT